MKAQKEIEKKIRQKEEDVRRLENELLQTRAYLDAMRESLRLIGKSSGANESDSLRPGSLVDKARTAIRKAGEPLHIDKILPAIGKELSKKNKISLSSSLAGYVREGFVFTRPAPNTFGLVEFTKSHSEGPPDGFGEDE
jgi:hypothetical protein